MPASKKVAKKVAEKKDVPETAPQYVTKKEFDDFGENVLKILEKFAPPAVNAGHSNVNSGDIQQGQTPVVTPETPLEKEIRKAGAAEIPMNPEWEELARDIIGVAVDHCEIQYLQNGGVVFTVVIKKEHSNANKDYIDRMGSDRRSKEIGSEGLGGVEAWCKLIRQNLSRDTSNRVLSLT